MRLFPSCNLILLLLLCRYTGDVQYPVYSIHSHNLYFSLKFDPCHVIALLFNFFSLIFLLLQNTQLIITHFYHHQQHHQYPPTSHQLQPTSTNFATHSIHILNITNSIHITNIPDCTDASTNLPCSYPFPPLS